MRKTIPVLSGIAILTVVMNHANFNVLGQFTPGLEDLLAALPYLLIDQTHKFGVPTFIFVTGYFIAYAAGGARGELKWSVVQARLPWLIIPWVLWATLHFAAVSAMGRPATFEWYARTLFIQYYFIPMLLFYYLTAVVTVRWAKTNPRGLLLRAGLMQVAMVALYTARSYLVSFPPELYPYIDIGPLQYLRFAFYFPFGVVVGMYPQQARAALAPWKRYFPWAILVAYILQTAEAANAFRMGGLYYPVGGDHTRFTSMLYALAILFTLITQDSLRIPLRKSLAYFSSISLGLYLSHYIFVGVFSALIEPVLPYRGWTGLLQMLFVSATALGAAVAAIEITRRIPIKGFFRFVFG